MTVGIPITMSFQSSNVIDPVIDLEELLQDCQAPIFSDGLEVRDSEFIFEYTSDIDFIPKTWTQADQDKGVYDLDEIIFKDCKLQKIVGKKGEGFTEQKRAKEPEEYSGWDGGIDFANYSHRYMRVSSAQNDGWLKRMWYNSTGNRWYYMFWEARGYGGCGAGAWRWSVKDQQHQGERTIIDYQRSCMLHTYSNRYNSAKDIKAVTYSWKSPDSAGVKEPIIQFKSMIERNGYFYFRTHLNKPIEFKTWITGQPVEYMFMDVISPADIKGFVNKRRINAQNPFDGKNYTKTIANTESTGGKATWQLLAVDEFDSVAFGRIICNSIDIKFMELDGTIISEINNYQVDNSVSDVKGDIEYPSTVVLYAQDVIPAESVIEITIWGDIIEVGEILSSNAIDAGFTKASFKNNFRDFSPKEQDRWGNWTYIDGVRVHKHSGTVDFKVLSYDQMNRLMNLIGGRKVVVNSSDSTNNEAPDSKKVFDATMMIARFTKLELTTASSKKRIDEIASYTFDLEEIV